MEKILIRNFKPEDVAGISRLDKKYNKAYPDTSVVQAELYLSPEFEEGKNVICAFSEEGTLVGYAPVYPVLAAEGNGYPNILWVEIKVDPDFPDKRPLRDMLFDKMMARSVEIRDKALVKDTKMSCSHYTTETESIDYLLSKGFASCEGIYNMTRDLSEPIAEAAPPEGLKIVEWRMETREERAKYIEAYNIVFPERTWNVEGLEHFMKSDMWVGGTIITAFDGDDIAGGVMLYWKTDGEAEDGNKQAYTENIFVMPKWRKKGVASCMIGKGLSYLAQRGAKTALLQVRANNIRALDIYKRMGYKVVKEQKVLEYSLND